VIVGIIRRKPVLTHASIVCEGMLATVGEFGEKIGEFGEFYIFVLGNESPGTAGTNTSQCIYQSNSPA